MTDTPAQALASMAWGIQRCRKCPLHEQRRHAVPGEGPAGAAVMLVGEAPGAEEDRTGRPFQGDAGRFLDEALVEAGLARERLFVTSCVKCRPPHNRAPHAGELSTCTRAWLERQVARVDPGHVVALGRVAAQALVGEDLRLARDHGLRRGRDGRPHLVTYHPAAAMRFPDARHALREDLATLARRL